MTTARTHRRLLLAGITFLATCTFLAAGWLFFANQYGAGFVWLGPGLQLAPQVAARLEPTGQAPEYDSADPDGVASMYMQPIEPLKGWRIVRVRAANALPFWQSVLDDDPTFSLEVDLDVEHADGRRSRLRWSTWRYGLVVGPIVVSYGDGPPGALSRVPDAP